MKVYIVKFEYRYDGVQYVAGIFDSETKALVIKAELEDRGHLARIESAQLNAVGSWAKTIIATTAALQKRRWCGRQS